MKTSSIFLGLASVLAVYQVLALPCQRRVCILNSAAMYNRKSPEAMMKPEDINPFLCTHLIYGFALLKGKDIIPESKKDESTDDFIGDYQKVMNLRMENPHIKILLSLGGWGQDKSQINNLFDTPETLGLVVRNMTQYIKDREFDGLDIMWVIDRSTSLPVKTNLIKMIKRFREEFNKETDIYRRLLLTSTVYGPRMDVIDTYEKFIEELDFINILVQDMLEKTVGHTLHHSVLYTGNHTRDPNGNLSLAVVSHKWMYRGIPREKIVLGIPFFGRVFTLQRNDTSLGAPAKFGSFGKYDKQAAYRPYFEICEMIQDGGKVHYIKDQRAPYLVYNHLWVGYDNEDSVTEKVKFIKENSFGGVIIYPINDDDFSGKFCGKGTFPLMKAINDACSLK